mmetsp:Transcript_2566/g.6371  ORF Transcript_2566/g.6371 Transcript_2566/m.6371 type:complete len:512 (+) Transcript_2566:295-1830(+)
MPRKGSSSGVRDSRPGSRVLSRLPRRSHAAAAVVLLSMALTMAKAIANVVASARTAPSRDFQLDHHLSTKTLYAHRTAPPGGVPLDQIPPPEGCNPSFIYLLSRHGARYPTSGKMKLASSVAPLLARSGAPALQDWEYVFAGESQLNGQLHRLGAEELSGIGRRYAARFPGIFDPHVTSDPIPSTFTLVRSTQKPRCSASAVAFMKGFTQAAFPLSMAPLERDPLLRFFDMCPAYGRYKDAVKECLGKWAEGLWAEMVPSVAKRLQLVSGDAPTPQEVGALWALCQQEAMLGRQDWACALFTPEQLRTLEWVEDVSALDTKAYGSCLAYQMAAPLMLDSTAALRSAANQSLGSAGEAAAPRSVLNFAHAETIIPYSSLLGMFGSPGACNLSSCGLGAEQGAPCQADGWYAPARLPRDGPRRDVFRGSAAAPFAANVAHILYVCPPRLGTGARHLVRTVYNEYAVPLPACDGQLDCPLEDFLAIADSLDDNILNTACQEPGGAHCRPATSHE